MKIKGTISSWNDEKGFGFMRRTSISNCIAVLFLAIVGVSVVISKIPPLILVLYITVSLAAFIMYALDKSAARKGRWRTKENTLHLISLFGGWPGAMLAQQKLRHKSQKQSFRLLFLLTVLLNSGAFFLLFTPKGTAVLKFLNDYVRHTDISVLKMLF